MQTAEIIRILTAEYPVAVWFVPSIVLLILLFVSFVDARTGRLPDLPMAVGAVGAVFALAWYAGWLVAGERLLLAIAAVAVVRLANGLYFRLFHRDALGFGDAKWTGLAVIAFGVAPVAWGWVIGAWLGLIWLGVSALVSRFRSTNNGEVYLHFAPFLVLGLIVALFKKFILVSLHLI